jgi:hypothetical protein
MQSEEFWESEASAFRLLILIVKHNISLKRGLGLILL